VEREYDIFEKYPDGSLLWRAAVTGRDQAAAKLHELAAQTANEVQMIHVSSKTVIAVLNAPQAKRQAS
jgi:hypothetical protein